MVDPSQNRARALAALGLALALIAGACGGGNGDADDEAASAPVTSAAAPKTDPSTTTTASSARPCDDDNLRFGAGASYPGAEVLDRTCSSTTALATVQASGIPSGVGVGFFQVGAEGVWTLVTVVSVDADIRSALPEGFSSSLISSWRSRYDARLRVESGEGGGDVNEVGGVNDESGTTTTTEPVNLCELLPPDLPIEQVPVECGGLAPAEPPPAEAPAP